MNMHRWVTVGCFALSICCQAVLADATNTLAFIGFSHDARYLAFESYGEGGSAFSYPNSTIFVVDVEKNKWANAPIRVAYQDQFVVESVPVVDEVPVIDEVRKEAFSKAKVVLSQFGISSSETGFHAYSRLSGDYSENPTLLLLSEEAQPWRVLMNGVDKYHLGMHQASLTGANAEGGAYDDAKLLRVTLAKQATGKREFVTPVVLQNDTEIPKGRGKPFAYRFKDVYFHSGRIAIFVEYFNYGFEGADNDFMVITGSLP